MTSTSLDLGRRTFFVRIPPDRAGFVANSVSLWILVLSVAVADLVLWPWAGFPMSADGLMALNPLLAAVLTPVAAFYVFLRYDETIASVTNALAVLMAITPLLCLLTYIATALGHGVPLRDEALARFDEAIGFHWPAMLRWFDLHPALADLGRRAYRTLPLQTVTLVIALTLRGRAERVQITIYAFAFGAILCALGSALVPALGAYAFYGIDASRFANLALVTGDVPVSDILALRAGTFSSFTLDGAKGIVSFPSYHMTLALVYTWASWPVRWLRYPVLAVNAALVLATPLHGSHYLVDLVAGTAVGLLSVAAGAGLHRTVAGLAAGAGASLPVKDLRAA